MKILAILGPTAVGKTATSLEIARNLGNVEIISCDSAQVYKYMDIGTDKVSPEIRKEIPHHLIDIRYPNEIYDAMSFKKDAEKLIEEIQKRGKIPVIVGGTTFYFKTLVYGIFEGPAKNEEIRKELQKTYNEKGIKYLYEYLQKVDPVAAQKINQNDLKRIIRALEVFLLTGKPISEWWKEAYKNRSKYQFFVVALTRERKELYSLIDKRIENMFKRGFLEECKFLIERYDVNLPSLQSLGYKQAIEHLLGKKTLEEAITEFKRKSRDFVKKQYNMLKRIEGIHWINVEGTNYKSVADTILKLWNPR